MLVGSLVAADDVFHGLQVRALLGWLWRRRRRSFYRDVHRLRDRAAGARRG